jgi:gas vesicle protein
VYRPREWDVDATRINLSTALSPEEKREFIGSFFVAFSPFRCYTDDNLLKAKEAQHQRDQASCKTKQRITDHMARWLIFVVFACLVAALAAVLSGNAFPYQALVIQVLLGGFIGGITNTIAITMLFEKKWYLPGSGVLLKKHKDIVRSLARTVETHLVNSEMLQAEMKKLLAPVNADKAGEIMNSIVDEFRGDVRDYLQSQPVHDEIRDASKARLGVSRKVPERHAHQGI